VGIAPLILAIVAFLSTRKKEVMFWGGLVVVALLFATQNPISEFPYKLSIPFFSSTQPTRLILLVDIALPILAAIGFVT